jgi:acetoin:2,6-dichlorophenolindophenol oxidoreductase subunit alpha
MTLAEADTLIDRDCPISLTSRDRDELRCLFILMERVRQFEERVRAAYVEGLVHGTTHLCIGQEAVCAGVVASLRVDDYLTYTYRGHGVCIARGMSMSAAFAEIFGRVTGVSGGLGGSMHLTDPDLNLIGAAGIVGGGLPLAVGAGLSAQLAGRGQVSVTFFGDGAANIGAFHECLNLAAVWRLPVVFICENNYYGEFTRIDRTTPFEELVRRAAAYAMEAAAVDGNDVVAVRDATAAAVARARAGAGPTFLECRTYRHAGHSRTDPGKYRPQEEVESWLARDPLPAFERRLVAEQICGAEELQELKAQIAAEVTSAALDGAAASWPTARDYLDRALVRGEREELCGQSS